MLGESGVTPSGRLGDEDGDGYFLTMINTLCRRGAVPPDLFYDYWRDAHVQIASRLPGIDTLWTHHVSFELGGIWPAIEDIGSYLPEEHQFDGIPEPCFRTEEDLGRFADAMGPLMSDEENIFEETISYQSFGQNSHTYIDRLDPTPNGDHGATKFMVFLKKREGVDIPTFRDFLAEQLAPLLADSPHVMKFRLHLLEEYQNSDVALDAKSRRVSHYKPLAMQYQAVYEIAFRDPLGMASLHASTDWRDTISEQRRHIREAHVCLVTKTYTWRYQGEMTLAALRTAAVADQIRRVGAINQLRPEVANLMQRPQRSQHERKA